MKEIRYGIREIATKKIVLTYHTERDAVQFCGRLNRKANDEKFEIVKIVTTIEIEEVAQTSFFILFIEQMFTAPGHYPDDFVNKLLTNKIQRKTKKVLTKKSATWYNEVAPFFKLVFSNCEKK